MQYSTKNSMPNSPQINKVANMKDSVTAKMLLYVVYKILQNK